MVNDSEMIPIGPFTMFRFTIRELLLLTVIVGLGLGWSLDRRTLNAYRERTDFLEQLTDVQVLSGKAIVTWTDIYRLQVLDEEAQKTLDRIEAGDAELQKYRKP